MGGGGGAGVVAEEFLDQRWERHPSDGPRGKEVWTIPYPHTTFSRLLRCAHHADRTGQPRRRDLIAWLRKGLVDGAEMVR